MKRFLITGSNGFLGSHLIQKMQQDHELFALTRNKVSFQHPNITEVQCDLLQSNFTDDLPTNIDCIIHLAQSAHYRDFPEKVDDVFSVNSISCLRLLDFARRNGVSKFILASSGIVYGKPEGVCKEDDALSLQTQEMGFYYVSKIVPETIAETYFSYMDITILRFFFIYGPRQRKMMLIPQLVEKVMHQQPIFLHRDDGFQLNPVYVSDAVGAIKASVSLNGSHIINVAGPNVYTLREIGEHIGLALGKEPIFEIDSLTKPIHMIADITKMKEHLVSPIIPFDEGIRKYSEYTYPGHFQYANLDPH